MSSLLKQIFGKADPYSELRKYKDSRTYPVGIPLDLANPMMDEILERNYLDNIGTKSFKIDDVNNKLAWLRITRIPLHPSQQNDYDLSIKWQQALSALHSWGEKVVFVLQRQKGETGLYLGLAYNNSTYQSAISRLQCALYNCMPGIEVHLLGECKSQTLSDASLLQESIKTYSCAGAITGIPSIKSAIKTLADAQTLDQLAFGIRRMKSISSVKSCEFDCPFSLLVVANPVLDSTITETIGRYQKLGSDMHALANYHVSDGNAENKTLGQCTSLNANIDLGTIMQMLLGIGGGQTGYEGAATSAHMPIINGDGTISAFNGSHNGNPLGRMGLGFSKTYSDFTSVSETHSVNRDYLNKFAQQTEKNCDAHCDRLRQGRNYGFWNVGVSILADADETVHTVMGMLRSVYSGDKTYLEPLRLHHLHPSSLPTIQNFNLIPILSPNVEIEGLDEGESWHILGSLYEYLSTPITTEELSLVTSLPRKDVPGLRFVRSAARFANNPGLCEKKDALVLGKVVDCGQELANDYRININSLVKHSLIVGSTGCGKTTTCKKILNEVMKHNIPVLIIEPAKDEYVRWAVNNNKNPKNKKINIYMPGMANFKPYGDETAKPKRLKLNPFQPATIKGAPIDLLTRTEQFTSIFNTSIPTGDVLPVLVDEAFNRFMHNYYGDNFLNDEYIIENADEANYPQISDVLPVVQEILKEKNYSEEVSRGLLAALTTRLSYLCRGSRGRILDVNRSTPYRKLFSQPTVINLSRIANSADKSLIMSLIMLSMYEFATSSYLYDPIYSDKAKQNRLLHLTVVEEAHNVLRKPEQTSSGDGNSQQVVASLFGNMLSEIRSYGEGLMIVDQVPTRLIDDVVRNTNLKIVHKLSGIDDCQVMSQSLGLMPGQEGIIPLMTTGNVLIASDGDDAASWVRIQK